MTRLATSAPTPEAHQAMQGESRDTEMSVVDTHTGVSLVIMGRGCTDPVAHQKRRTLTGRQ